MILNKIYLACALTVTLSFHCHISVCQQNHDRPNILFISIDDLNDWTGFLGGHPQAQTPNMDKLAENGINFTNAYAPSPGCAPSRISILYGIETFNSGLYPFYQGEIHNELMEKYVSLPSLLKSGGYRTQGAGKIHHAFNGDPREWDSYFEIRKIKKKIDRNQSLRLEKNKMSFGPTINPEGDHIDHQVITHGIDVLNAHHDEPFFLAVGLTNTHLPFTAPLRFFDNVSNDISAPEIIPDDLSDLPLEAINLSKQGLMEKLENQNAWPIIRRSYMASISWVDYNVGRILTALEESKYCDNTIVILWSDHGFHFGEKSSFQKFTLWRDALRVPFLIHDTRKPEICGNYDDPVSLINIYKTIADYAELDVPDYVDGKSLSQIMNDTISEFNYPTISTWGRGNFAVSYKNWRYIRYFDKTEELYDLNTDPHEWYNLSGHSQYKEIKRKLMDQIPEYPAKTVKSHSMKWSLIGDDI